MTSPGPDLSGPTPPGAVTAAEALARLLAETTPARLLLGRSGTSLPTATALQLRADHAAAQDAVSAELDLRRPPLSSLVTSHGLFAVASAARDHATHLQRPDLGRRLPAAAQEEVARCCPPGADVQIVVGDGLSATAVAAQVPALLPLVVEEARRRGLSVGRPFAVQHCRVGVMNDVGALLDPAVVVLLIGERPGLATAESLSAYLAYRPRPGHSDAERNLLSNIHARGIPVAEAASRIVAFAATMIATRASGVAVREPDHPAHLPPPPTPHSGLE